MKRIICALLGHHWRFSFSRYLPNGGPGVDPVAVCAKCGKVVR